MKAMIFAAGLGSRLKPFTDTSPKALVKIGDKTLLQINIERIMQFGIHEMVINVHHFSDQVIAYLKEHHNFGARIHISDESETLLDTGGALNKAAPFLKGNEPILLQNVDIYSNIDYQKMLEFHNASNALATLAVRNRESSRYLQFNRKGELCGWQDIRSGKKIISRAANEVINMAFSGIHLISPKVLDLLPPKNIFSIIDSYLELAKEFTLAGYVHDDDYWFDVGTPQKVQNLEFFLSKNK